MSEPSAEDLAKGYINFFEPDVFVEAQQGLADKIGITGGELDLGRPRVMPLDAFFATDEQREEDVPFGTNVFYVYRSLYGREFKFVPRHERRVATFEADSVHDFFAAACFGEFPTSGPLAPLSQAYSDAFDPSRWC